MKKSTAARTIGISTLFFVGLGIFGFIMLMRGCLGRYDQRFKFSKGVIVESNGQDILFTLVEKRKTTSYSRGGAINYTRYNTTIWIQTLDMASGKELKRKKLMNIRKVKNHPIECWGAANQWVWCFINEVRAYDPTTLEEKFNLKILEEKNPSLKGKLPAENQYYEPHIADGYIKITALDGVEYALDLNTQQCAPWKENTAANPYAQMETRLKELQDEMDSNYAWMRRYSQQYSDEKLTYKEYQKNERKFMDRRDSLEEIIDSLQTISRESEDLARELENYKREIDNFKDISYYDLGSISQTTDSLKGHCYLLRTEEAAAKLDDYFRIDRSYEEKDRNGFYTGMFEPRKSINSYLKIDLSSIKRMGTTDFLQGGFLVDFSTARAIHLSNPDGFLVVHRDIIGDNALFQVSRVDMDGKVVWTVNSELPVRLEDICISSRYLVLFGCTNHELSGDAANSIVMIDLASGQFKVYDYMQRRKRD